MEELLSEFDMFSLSTSAILDFIDLIFESFSLFIFKHLEFENFQKLLD